MAVADALADCLVNVEDWREKALSWEGWVETVSQMARALLLQGQYRIFLPVLLFLMKKY